MKFTVQNLGRLAEATIDLDKDLILFVGPNNTSKTYVAHTLYGFFSRIVSLLDKVVSEILSSEKREPSLSIDLRELLKDQCRSLLTSLNGLYRAELSDILAADDNFTANTIIKLATNDGAADRLSTLLYQDDLTRDFHVDQRYNMRATIEPDKLVLRFVFYPTNTVYSDELESSDFDIFQRLATRYTSSILPTTLFYNSETYILPAERAAIQLFSRELSIKRSNLIDHLLTTTRRRRDSAELTRELRHNAQRYPAGIRAYLELTNDLPIHRKSTSKFAHFADLLDEILDGTLHVTDDGDVRFQPGSDAPHLDLHLASSSVKALAGLSFHLRHLLAADNILIIDEPELNLHPDNQRRVARVLARLARGGVKVIITTHSDYIVRELNNLIMLSAEDAGELRERHGYIAEETLKPAQVGAYRFDTTHAHPLEVKPTGIEVESIDREINALNKVSQDIYFSLFDKA